MLDEKQNQKKKVKARSGRSKRTTACGQITSKCKTVYTRLLSGFTAESDRGHSTASFVMNPTNGEYFWRSSSFACVFHQTLVGVSVGGRPVRDHVPASALVTGSCLV